MAIVATHVLVLPALMQTSPTNSVMQQTSMLPALVVTQIQCGKPTGALAVEYDGAHGIRNDEERCMWASIGAWM